MKSIEKNVDPSSEYFNYVPSLQSKSAFFYPICMGHFIYKPGYMLERNSYDSFLLMYVQKGEVCLETRDFSCTANENDFILLDCHSYHKYSTKKGYDCLWLHFDAWNAAEFYKMITKKLGNVFQIGNSRTAADKISEIIRIFSVAGQISEAYISKLITDILTEFLIYENEYKSKSANFRSDISMENIVSYINEHFCEELTIETLSLLANLSPYHFIRMFKHATGYTPHEYLINTRLENAKYLLTTTKMSAKEICFSTGFSSESIFCSTFRRKTGKTPSDFPNHPEHFPDFG